MSDARQFYGHAATHCTVCGARRFAGERCRPGCINFQPDAEPDAVREPQATLIASVETRDEHPSSFSEGLAIMNPSSLKELAARAALTDNGHCGEGTFERSQRERHQVYALQALYDAMPPEDVLDLLSRLEAAEARAARAEEALRPFADAVAAIDDNVPPDLRAEDSMSIEWALFEHQQPTVGDLRRARSTLSEKA